MRTLERLLGNLALLLLTESLLGLVPPCIAYEVSQGTDGAVVSGRVVLVGPLPKTKPLPVHRDSAFCGKTMPNESLVVDASRNVSGVVISLEGITRGKPLPAEQTLTIENRACRFLPRISAMAVGTHLAISNADPIMHNTHVRKDNRFGSTVVNVAQPAGARVIKKPLNDTGPLDIRCDAHPFMYAGIYVFDHPYFSVTNESGWFEMTQVPPGTYRLVLRHELLGTREQKIVVPDKGALTLELQIRQEETP